MATLMASFKLVIWRARSRVSRQTTAAGGRNPHCNLVIATSRPTVSNGRRSVPPRQYYFYARTSRHAAGGLRTCDVDVELAKTDSLRGLGLVVMRYIGVITGLGTCTVLVAVVDK